MDLQGFDAYLKAKADTHVGYPYNLRYDYSELAPFFRYSINNLGDPYVESNYLLHSRAYEKDTVAFFAELYGAGDYWGYVTTSGTEGNLYGVLLGREQYPEGVLTRPATRIIPSPRPPTFSRSRTSSSIPCPTARSTTRTCSESSTQAGPPL